MKEDTSGLLQRLKRNFKNQRISAADLSGTRDIPSLMSDYKDLVVFTKRREPFVDVELMNQPDPTINVRDLEDLRREIVMLSGVPAAYLGMADHYELREQLVHTNIVFANEVSSIQNVFNKQLTDMYSKIAELLGVEDDLQMYVHISLMPPTVLLIQLIEATIGSVSNIQRVFTDMPGVNISALSLLKQYVPYFNWDELIDEADENKQKSKVKQSGDEEEGGGFGKF